MTPVSHVDDIEFKRVIENSLNIRDAIKQFGLGISGANYSSVKTRIEALSLDVSHMGRLKSTGKKLTIPLDDILKEGVLYDSRDLKRRLLKVGLLGDKCAICGCDGTWMDKPITLQLDHINGKHDDNRIENLRILCPNCHTQTDTWGMKRPKKFCKGCNVKLSMGNKSGLCYYCNTDKRIHYKVELKDRPDKETLLKMTAEIGYSAVGRQFGVSDNAVRKWLR